MAAGPRRQGWRQSSGEHLHGVGAYRARLADTGGRGGLPRWRWSYCGDGEAAKASYRRQGRWRTLCARTAAAAGEKETKAKQMGCAAESGRALGRLRRALAWLCCAGQGAGDARLWLATTRRIGSEPVGHRAGRFSLTEIEMGRLTAGFQVEQTLNPWTSSQNFLNRICRPMY